MIRVIIADDQTLFREGLRHLLGIKKNIEIVGETGSGRETISLCAEKKPDVLLLDLDMPDMDGFEVTRCIASSEPDVKILILTMHSTEEYAYRLIKMGASGFIVKDVAARELANAIEKIAAGKTYITPSIMEGIGSRLRKPQGEDPLSLLSDRELEVVTRLARGLNNRDIADKLCLSSRTVETYRSRAMTKLNIRNLPDLTRFAIQQGLVNRF